LHHRILDAGLCSSHVTLIMLSLTAFMALMALVAQAKGLPDYVLFYAWLMVFVMHTVGIMHPRGYLYFVRVLKARLK